MPYKDPDKRREYHRNYNKKWIVENRERWNEIQSKSDMSRREKPQRVAQLSEVRFRRHHRNKVKVLETYGKKCAWCGEEKYEVLCIDHIKDDGAEHRRSEEYKKLNNGGMYGFLSKTEYRPDLYQVLCANCNHAKQFYKVKKDGKQYRTFEYWKSISELRTKKVRG